MTYALPSTRSIDWTLSGVPGGIPSRTTIYATLTNGATQAQIQTQLDACPANQVVKLGAGTYNITGTLTVPTGVVLRGTGPMDSVLNLTGASGVGVRLGTSVTPATANSTAISSGSTKASTQFVVASATGISIGTMLMVTQLNTAVSAYCYITTTNGSCTFCDGGIGWNGTRVMGQIVEVTGVSGTTIDFTPPLYADYSAGTPLATRFTIGGEYIGLEDLQLYANNTGLTANVGLDGIRYSWMKNCYSNYCDGDHLQMHWGFRNTLHANRCYGGMVHSAGSTESSIALFNKSSACQVTNNQCYRNHISINLSWGSSGNVVAYNYCDHNYDSSGFNSMFEGIVHHGAHPMFTLIEGNITAKINLDYYWGTSSHDTLYRNWAKGVNEVIPPVGWDGSSAMPEGRLAEDTAATYWAPYAHSCVDLCQTARYHNLLGNVLGTTRQRTVGTWIGDAVDPTDREFYTSTNHFRVTYGYANLSDNNEDAGDNDEPYTTRFQHGDYDNVSQAFIWDGGEADHVLASSLYLAAKPTWFSTLSFPPFGPDPASPTTPLVGNIPAKAAWDASQMPEAWANSQLTGAAFNLNCLRA